jgi:hypothetical protein
MSNISAPSFVKQTLLNIKKQIDTTKTIMVGGFKPKLTKTKVSKAASMEIIMEFCQKIGNRITILSCFTTLGHISEGM